jgi:hypothetical protein
MASARFLLKLPGRWPMQKGQKPALQGASHARNSAQNIQLHFSNLVVSLATAERRYLPSFCRSDGQGFPRIFQSEWGGSPVKSLVDIVYGQNSAEPKGAETLAITTRAQVKLASLAILGASLGATKASQFAEGAANLITDKEFLGELQSEIGLPEKAETEDEFVARAKEAMFEMLKSKLT